MFSFIPLFLFQLHSLTRIEQAISTKENKNRWMFDTPLFLCVVSCRAVPCAQTNHTRWQSDHSTCSILIVCCIDCPNHIRISIKIYISSRRIRIHWSLSYVSLWDYETNEWKTISSSNKQHHFFYYFIDFFFVHISQFYFFIFCILLYY